MSIQLPSKYIAVNETILDIWVGIGPIMKLFSRFKYSNVVNNDISLGMVPITKVQVYFRYTKKYDEINYHIRSNHIDWMVWTIFINTIYQYGQIQL